MSAINTTPPAATVEDGCDASPPATPRLSNGRAIVSAYRMLVFTAIFFSGVVALTFQVVWQKYLSFLLGSEARSISLVIAVFLFGLATGYHLWGRMTQRDLDRRSIARIAGVIELGIALWALGFPWLYDLMRSASYAAPDWLVIDLAVAAVLLFVPTFLMGALIPLMTSVVPEHMREVNHCHSRIYGINTLGAFAGAFVAGFWLVPALGLSRTLVVGAAVNIAVALVFLLNRFRGLPLDSGEIPRVANRFGMFGIGLLVIATGTVSIAFEILFMRLLGLAIGSGPHIFPIVVGMVILGLAIGALSLRAGRRMTAGRVFRELTVFSVVCVVLYLSVPYWAYWLSCMRVSLRSIPANYPVYLAAVTVFASIVLLPMMIPLGRLLPLGYAMLDKNRSNYGRQCGTLYFINTIGTVAGAVGIGYGMARLLSLDSIFKLNIALVLAVIAILAIKQRLPLAAALALVLAGLTVALPAWDRQSHMLGLFRTTSPDDWHYSGLFIVPSIVPPEDVLYFADDPEMTVSVFAIETDVCGGDRLPSRSLAVNGKSDGNTVGDYSTVILLGLLPYLHANGGDGLNAAVVGLGTGMTSGVLAAAPDVQQVTTLELSPSVIDALPLFDEANFGLSRSGKSRIIQTDAFRYFARTANQYDIIVSEPSNPWVVGVENLFTTEFYALVDDVLTDDGVFFQWVQVYEMSDDVFAGIVSNLTAAFEHVSLFTVGAHDVGILASRRPLVRRHGPRRMRQPVIRDALAPIGIDDERMFSLLEMYQTPHLRAIARRGARQAHSTDLPWIGYAAARSRFLGRAVALGSEPLLGVGRHVEVGQRRQSEIMSWLDEHGRDVNRLCSGGEELHSADIVCSRAAELSRSFLAVRLPILPDRVLQRIESYRLLRELGLIDADRVFLDEMHNFVREAPHALDDAVRARVVEELAREYAFEGWEPRP